MVSVFSLPMEAARWFEWLPDGWFPIGFILLILVVALLFLWMSWTPSLPFTSLHGVKRLKPHNLSARPRSLLSTAEATLYNVVQLAAQDRYLVFVKLPIGTLIVLSEKDDEVRKQIVRTIQPFRLDIVLVHPGSLCAAKVIRLRTKGNAGTSIDARYQMVETLLQSAGIEIIHLDPLQTYTVAALVRILGLEEEE